MSKPSDMADDIWKAATQLSHLIYCEIDDAGNPYIPADEIITIALALQAAKLEAYEEAAKVARTHGQWGTTWERNHTALPQTVSGEITKSILALGAIAK